VPVAPGNGTIMIQDVFAGMEQTPKRALVPQNIAGNRQIIGMRVNHQGVDKNYVRRKL